MHVQDLPLEVPEEVQKEGRADTKNTRNVHIMMTQETRIALYK